MIELVGSDVVFRNPRPELVAVGAWHPSLVRLGATSWLCSFDLGQAPESHDYATHVSRSDDDGRTWSDPLRLVPPEPAPRATHSIRVGRLSDGRLLGVGPRFLRADADRGLINHPGLGYTEMELVLTSSEDEGRTWSAPRVIAPALPGPFETCHAPLELASGRILWPTSTWMRWDGTAPEGMRAVALLSDDGGASWPDHLEVIDQWDRGVVSWEQSMVALDDGRLLAVVWSVRVEDGSTLPTTAVLTGPGDATFGDPLATGIRAQTAKIASLGGSTVLAVYRRHDEPGLWASIARVDPEAGGWETLSSTLLWNGAGSGMDGRASVGEELSALEFGYPSIVVEPGPADGSRSVAVAFWCAEGGPTGVRLLRLRVSQPHGTED